MSKHTCSKCAITFGRENAPVAKYFYLSKTFNIEVYVCAEHALQIKKVEPNVKLEEVKEG